MPRKKAQPKEKEMEITVTRRVKLVEKVCPVKARVKKYRAEKVTAATR